MKFSMMAVAACALSASVHGFAGTPLKSARGFAVRNQVGVFEKVSLARVLWVSVTL